MTPPSRVLLAVFRPALGMSSVALLMVAILFAPDPWSDKTAPGPVAEAHPLPSLQVNLAGGDVAEAHITVSHPHPSADGAGFDAFLRTGAAELADATIMALSETSLATGADTRQLETALLADFRRILSLKDSETQGLTVELVLHPAH